MQSWDQAIRRSSRLIVCCSGFVDDMAVRSNQSVIISTARSLAVVPRDSTMSQNWLYRSMGRFADTFCRSPLDGRPPRGLRVRGIVVMVGSMSVERHRFQKHAA